jgi:hypothetical protein
MDSAQINFERDIASFHTVSFERYLLTKRQEKLFEV